MNLIFRMLRVFTLAWLRGRLTPTETSVVSFRVLPNDLDVFMHMNNGRYPTMMDLGRLDLITRIGMSTFMFQRRWYPIVAALHLRFRRPLYLFQRYTLQSRIRYWDEKWFYIEQQFIRGEDVVAVGWIKGLIRGPEGNIPTAVVLQAVGSPMESPPPPTFVTGWQTLEQVK
ncbi:MAG: thioesterase family protein [Gammaproteobacteria bacterium]|nr:thioesterase family protein [Gammaproteobacteria bacterium]